MRDVQHPLLVFGEKEPSSALARLTTFGEDEPPPARKAAGALQIAAGTIRAWELDLQGRPGDPFEFRGGEFHQTDPRPGGLLGRAFGVVNPDEEIALDPCQSAEVRQGGGLDDVPRTLRQFRATRAQQRTQRESDDRDFPAVGACRVSLHGAEARRQR